jgi:2-polyprenyl-6-methoxyphenol hydroxylase-like FAD-dependent oxidoreductase
MSVDERYDVLIAGAGLRGATATHDLGRAGAWVIIVEREKLPRYKPCGGAVPAVVYTRFPFSVSVGRYAGRITHYARRTLEPARMLARDIFGCPQVTFRYGMRNTRATRVISSWMTGSVSRAQGMTLLLLCVLEGVVQKR